MSAMASQADDITVSAPFAREVPPGAPASASFMTLENQSTSSIKLKSADSSAAKVVELHTHTNDNGGMRMRKVPFIKIPASGKTELKPGGLHIMLVGPHNPLKMGQEGTVKLTFEDGSTKSVAMPVNTPPATNRHDKMAQGTGRCSAAGGCAGLRAGHAALPRPSSPG